MKRLLWAVMMLGFYSMAGAQTFTINLPSSGPISDVHAAFSGLNGTAVTGQHLLIDFVYPTGVGLHETFADLQRKKSDLPGIFTHKKARDVYLLCPIRGPLRRKTRANGRVVDNKR